MRRVEVICRISTGDGKWNAVDKLLDTAKLLKRINWGRFL